MSFLAQLLADLGEVLVKPGRVLYLNERELIVFAHPDHLDVPEVVLVLCPVPLLFVLPLDLDRPLLSEPFQDRVAAAKAFSILQLPLLYGHRLDEGKLFDALCSDVLEEALALASPRVLFLLVFGSGLLFI